MTTNQPEQKKFTEEEVMEIQKAADSASNASKLIMDTMTEMVEGLGAEVKPLVLLFEVNMFNDGKAVEFLVESITGTTLYHRQDLVTNMEEVCEQLGRIFGDAPYEVYTVKQVSTKIATERFEASTIINLNPDQLDYNGKTVQQTVQNIRELYRKRTNQ